MEHITLLHLAKMFLEGVYITLMVLGGRYFLFVKQNKRIYHEVFALCMFVTIISAAGNTFDVVLDLNSRFPQYEAFASIAEQMVVPCFGVFLYSLVMQPKEWGPILNRLVLFELPYCAIIFLFLFTDLHYLPSCAIMYSIAFSLYVIVLTVRRIQHYHKLLENSYSVQQHRTLTWGYQVLFALTLFFLSYTILSFYYDAISTYLVYVVIHLCCIGFVCHRLDTQETVDMDMLNATDLSEREYHVSEEDAETDKLINDRFVKTKMFTKQDINIRFMANAVGLPINRLSDFLNNVKQLTFNEYINSLRIELACDILNERDMTTNEMLVATGFNTPSTYLRVFKLYTDMTPTEYREYQLKEKAQDNEKNAIVRSVRKKESRSPKTVVKKVSFDNLTRKEAQLARLIAYGRTSSEICDQMQITEPSLRVFKSRLRSKLQLTRNDNLDEIFRAALGDSIT